MPLKCPLGRTSYDACRGCEWLWKNLYCWIPPRLPKGGVSIYEVYTLDERVCLVEDDIKDILTLITEQPLPPNYQYLLDRVGQLAGKTEHLHQELHTKYISNKGGVGRVGRGGIYKEIVDDTSNSETR